MNSSEDSPVRGRRPGVAGLEQRVLMRFRRLRLPPGTTVLVGFSGGPDSVALAGALAHVAPLGRFNVVAVHVDHRLRAGSAEEQAVASELASRLGVRFRAESVSESPRTLHPGVGVEEAARRERYLAFARAAREAKAAIVALAHHEQDQAESVLLHLARGTGLSGASGMAELTTLMVPWWTDEPADDEQQITVWRPMLTEPRSVVRAYCAGTGLTPIQDPSNADLRLRRNALRHDVLPALERSSPGAVAALARFGRLAADEDSALETISMQVASDVVDTSGGLDPNPLSDWPIAVQRRVIRRWVHDQTGYQGLTANRVEAILGLVRDPSGSRQIEIGEALIAAVVGGVVRIGKPTALCTLARQEFRGPLFSAQDGLRAQRIEVDQTISIDGWQIAVRRLAAGSRDDRSSAHVATVANLGDDLVLRSPLRGDIWAVSGRKLSEWLKRQRVSSLIRADLVCLASRAGVHWVVGLSLPGFERRPDADSLAHIAVVKEQSTA